MTMKEPTVLTIILNYRTPEMTLKSLAAAIEAMEGIAGEITVVENGSGDDSHDLLAAEIDARGWARQGRVTLRRAARNGGFGAGNNLAMRAGLSDGRQPDVFYLLNSDAFPAPDAIRKLLDFMARNRQVGLAGSRIEGVDGTPHQTAFRFPSIAGELEGAARTGLLTRLLRDAVVPLPLPEGTARVDWVAGASLMLRRRMLDAIGLFDEGFFLYFEETDLCRRAARAGWETFYVASSRVRHIGSYSTGMKRWHRTPRYWFDSRLRYFTKAHGPAYAGFATLARIGGGALWRARVAASNRPLGDPPHFLRDLAWHHVSHLWARSQRPPAQEPATEDSK